MRTNLSLELLSWGLIALVLNEDVKFAVFGDVGVEAELIDTGATTMLVGATFGAFAIDACDNWA